MAKKIIILSKSSQWVGQTSITYALWADVPAARQTKYAQPLTWVSAYDGADSTELAALRAGQLAERVETTNVSASDTVATIKTILISAFNAYQTVITNESKWQFYGTFYDGTTWTTGGV